MSSAHDWRRLAYRVLAALFPMNSMNDVDRFGLTAVVDPVQETFGTSDAPGRLLTVAPDRGPASAIVVNVVAPPLRRKE